MLDHSVRPSEFQTFACLLKKCGLEKDIAEGKRIHTGIRRKGFHNNLHLGNLLLQMYLNCGSLNDVHNWFYEMHQKNKYSWNFFITAHARLGHHEHVMHAFHQMQSEGFLPNEFIFAGVVSSCARRVVLQDGQWIHAQLLSEGLQSNLAVGNVLINMYCKCNCLDESKRLFEEMPERNVVSWSDMILAYAHHGHNEDPVLLYRQMLQEGVLPNKITFINMLAACTFHQCETQGKHVHVNIVGHGLESEVMLVTGLLSMYGSFSKEFQDALILFECASNRNTVLWTALIGGCSQQGYSPLALEFYNRMLLEGELPDQVTCGLVLDVCASAGLLIRGKQMHAAINTDDLQSNIILGTSMVSMYLKCGCLKRAHEIFNEMWEHNLITWNAMITSYVHNGDEEQAIQLYKEMRKEGIIPDKSILWSIVDACVSQLALEDGKEMHGIIVLCGLDVDPSLAAGLINFYGKCRKLEEARCVLDKLLDYNNLVAWTAMITAYVHSGLDEEALLLYEQMQLQGVHPNKVTCICMLSACANAKALSKGRRIHVSVVYSEFYQDVVVMTALINMYGRCHSEKDARGVFDEMQERNVISWNVMLAAYSLCGSMSETLQLFKEMQQENIVPNKATFISVLDACASITILEKGKEVHMLAVHMGLDLDLEVENAIINMYSKCGELADANKSFQQMLNLDKISCNIIIGSFSQHGHTNMAIGLFQECVSAGYSPDNVTYVAVLSACGHAGLIVDGLYHFTSMIEDWNIVPTAEHYHCMIHMLTRSGLVEEARNFLDNMPIQPSFIAWMIFTICRAYPDMVSGGSVVNHVMELNEGENVSPYATFSNVFVSSANGEKN